MSVEVARFSCVTDALWLSLVGSWTSCALFRRPLMAVFSAVYGVASTGASKPNRPVLCSLSRLAAQELVLASVLCPLASVDLTTLFDPCLYATDASESKGGYVTAHVGVDLVRPLWRTASKRGGYSRLLSKEEALLVRLDDREPIDLRMMASSACSSPSRPFAYHFDFVEVGSGSGAVSIRMRALGHTVGPVLDFRVSTAYDLLNDQTFEWLLYLLQHRRLKSLFLWSPAAAFRSGSCAVRAASLRGTRANLVFRRHLALFSTAVHCGVPVVLMCPGLPGSFANPSWRRLLCLGARCFGTCACSFRGPCCKDWKFLVFGIDLASLSVPCCSAGSTVQRGRLQHPDDAFLPPLLVRALACEFDRALRRVSHVRSLRALQPEGLENPVLNDVVLSVRWHSGDDWCWRATAHINILETASIHRLIKALAVRGPRRVVILVDSSVAFHACAMGRSPSKGLMPILRKIASLCLLSGLLPAYHYVPTRLNPGDCPTRDLPLPEPCVSRFWSLLSSDELYEGLAGSKLRRWASNWVRLVCLVVGPPPSFRPSLDWRAYHVASRGFDSTLGFPGEGPFFRVFVVLWWFGVCCFAVDDSSHVLRPRHSADRERSRARSTVVLAEGRPVEPVTQKRRDKLLAAFVEWLLRQEVIFEKLLDLAPQSTRRLNNLLVTYGRQLFEAGWPYSHYSEVINAITSKEPAIRRNLQPAWDLAFAWLREEPHSHHVALPWQVLLAAISTSLMWGWVRVAGCLALTWGAVMRIGETLAARRSDLLLPGDVWGTMHFCMISIQEPKTRFKAARHQAAKLDQPDLLAVVALAFSDLEPGAKLWPFSASTLRNRFDQLMKRLGTNCWADQGSRRLDLGSLRAGGATWLLQASEDSELVRRRGRWLNARTMEIYLQEISSLQFVHRLSEQARLKVFTSVDNFKQVLLVAERLQKARTPTRFWFSHFAGG